MRRVILSVLLMAVFAIMGCASDYQRPDYSNVYWPRKPAIKRIQLLNIIYSDFDVISQKSSSSDLFGDGGGFYFKKPSDVIATPNGAIYVTDGYEGYVVKIDPINGASKLSDDWQAPYGIDYDSKNGLIGISDKRGVTLIRADNDKHYSSSRGYTPSALGGLSLDPVKQVVYVCDVKASKVVKFSYTGEYLGVLASAGTADGFVMYPADVANDAEGNVYVLDSLNWRVQVFSPEGTFLRKFGEHGSGVGQFGRPKGIDVSKDGIVLITDADFHVALIFDTNGTSLSYFGGSGYNDPGFLSPFGVFIDDDNKIYIVDQSNRRIKVFQLYTDRYYREHPEALQADTTAPAAASAAAPAATAPTPEAAPAPAATAPTPEAAPAPAATAPTPEPDAAGAGAVTAPDEAAPSAEPESK